MYHLMRLEREKIRRIILFPFFSDILIFLFSELVPIIHMYQMVYHTAIRADCRVELFHIGRYNSINYHGRNWGEGTEVRPPPEI